MAPLMHIGSAGKADVQSADDRTAKIVKRVTWGWVDIYESEPSAKRVRSRIDPEACQPSLVNLDILPSLLRAANLQKDKDAKRTALGHDNRMPQKQQQQLVNTPPGLPPPGPWQLHQSHAPGFWQPQQALNAKTGDWWHHPGLAQECKKSAAATTTLMLRNIPNKYTREALMELLDTAGFSGTYDFFYLPLDFATGAAFGYAFVNFVDQAYALQAVLILHGFQRWKFNSSKVCEARWSTTHQGLWQNIGSFRNHPVMHVDVPDAFKPVILLSGRRVNFPPPTSFVSPPKGLRLKAGIV